MQETNNPLEPQRRQSTLNGAAPSPATAGSAAQERLGASIPTSQSYTEEEVQEIYRRAAEMQSKEVFAPENLSTTHGEVEKAAGKAGIDEKYVDAAAAQMMAERQQLQKEAAERAARRARQAKILALGAGGVVLVGGLFWWSASATLNAAYSQVEARRAQVSSVVERRDSLLPRLVDLTRRSEETQKTAAQNLARAIENSRGTTDASQRAQGERQVSAAASDALRQILAQGGANADLARSLMAEWAGSENRIVVERKKLNESVAAYNQKARSFPVALFRPLLKYPPQIPYESGVSTTPSPAK